MDTQTQIDRLIELAIVQRTELKQLVEQLPQLREHLNAEIEKVFDEVEPQLRVELEDWTAKQTADQTAKLGASLEAKITELAKALEVSTQARYSAILAEREKNFALAAEAEAKIAEHAASLPEAVKGIVDAELARFPRAGEIDQLRKEFAEPKSLNPRGKWQAGVAYNKLDLVTINGDSYTSATDNNRTRPTRSSADWTLVAARGTGGGGGPTSLSELTTVPSNGDLLIGSGTSWVTSNLTAGAGISITVGAGEITISATDGDITLDDGTAASPSLHFTNDPDTGIYRPAANTLGISVSGTQVAYFDENGLTIPSAGVVAGGSFHAANGNANNPSHSFTSDQDTGFYRHATNQIGVSTSGVASLIFTENAGELLGHTGVSVTFGAGSSGATIALGQGTNGGVTITPKGSGTAVVNGTTIPASKTLVVTTDKLSALAATTSAELAGVISDETGTGALVFANTPTLVTPNIGAATGTSVNLSGAGTFGGNLTVTGSGTVGGASSGVITPQLTSQAYYQSGLLLTNTKADNAGVRNWALVTTQDSYGDFQIKQSATLGGSAIAGTAWLKISETGNTTLAGNLTVSGTGTNLLTGATTIKGPNNGTLYVDTSSATNYTSIYLRNNGGSNLAGIYHYTVDSSLTINSFGGSLIFARSAGETARIVNATGNLLLGTAIDGGQKLQVNGTSQFADRLTVLRGAGNSTNTDGNFDAIILRGVSGQNVGMTVATGNNSEYGAYVVASPSNSRASAFLANNSGGGIQGPGGSTVLSWDSTNATFAGKITANGAGSTFKGTSTNDDAAAGYVGEIITSTVESGSAVSLTSAALANITSISLTAGDWDVSGVVGYSLSGATVQSFLNAMNNASAALGPTGSFTKHLVTLTTITDSALLPTPVYRFTLTSTSTVYLIGRANFTAGTVSGYGHIRARRVR